MMDSEAQHRDQGVVKLADARHEIFDRAGRRLGWFSRLWTMGIEGMKGSESNRFANQD